MKLSAKKLLIVIISFVTTLIFDIIWLIINSSNYWNGENITNIIEDNIYLNNLYNVEKDIKRFIIFMTYMMLVVKVLNIYIISNLFY